MNALAELFRKLAGNERVSAATSLLWMDNLNQNYAKHSQVWPDHTKHDLMIHPQL